MTAIVEKALVAFNGESALVLDHRGDGLGFLIETFSPPDQDALDIPFPDAGLTPHLATAKLLVFEGEVKMGGLGTEAIAFSWDGSWRLLSAQEWDNLLRRRATFR